MQNLQKTWTSDFQSIIDYKPNLHVLALCLHPALDITVYTKNGKQTGRREDLGGKAVNLARMLHLLGARVTLVAPNDKHGLTAQLLMGCGYDFELIDTDLCLRKNVKTIDACGRIEEHNSCAGTLSPQHYAQLIDRVLHICRTRQISILALCGSFPQGVEKGVYKSLIERAKALNIACVTDATNDALSLAIQAKPCLIKPNLQEFCQVFSQDLSMLKTKEQVERLIFASYLATDVPILCSLDKHGCIYAGREGLFDVCGPIVEHVAGFAGAGDTLLASFLYARMLCNATVEKSLKFACAAATAKVRLPANTLPFAQQIFTEWTQIDIRKAEHEIY